MNLEMRLSLTVSVSKILKNHLELDFKNIIRDTMLLDMFIDTRQLTQMVFNQMDRR